MFVNTCKYYIANPNWYTFKPEAMENDYVNIEGQIYYFENLSISYFSSN